MIHADAARQLLNMGASIGAGRRAEEQLDGAVALHNILESRGVAYLADEVGMGKTYVALGALALFRHLNPDFRVLVIAPRANIQRKWIKELGNFCTNNVRFADLRVKALAGGPARPMVYCDTLRDFVHDVNVDARRDFFLRLTSFSIALDEKPEEWRKQRAQLQKEIPWLADEVFDLRNRVAFKDNYARAICCAIPIFDLVIVDEGHNLKHGFKESVAARNRVLALAMGRDKDVDVSLFPRYGSRAKKVLFLSATPIDESYVQLWNQLDVFGLGGPYSGLKRHDLSDNEKQAIVKQFLIRRVTTMEVAGKSLTKNQYRREWRQGGVREHDKPISVTDPKSRLVVALVQKKVAELLGSARFNMSFQIGMLASFESFLQTTLKTKDDSITFDDSEQNRDLREDERRGIDAREINRLTKNYFERFGHEMPHPKMDEVVQSLATAWKTGNKTLVFVRRVASVTELKKKLDECYDDWLIPHLQKTLPDKVRTALDLAEAKYRQAKTDAGPRHGEQQKDDQGGTDTFFAWFFRGEGPKNVISGANIQRRFTQAGSSYSTFFDRNHVAEVLGVQPGGVLAALATQIGRDLSVVRVEVRTRAARYLSGNAKSYPRRDRFLAAQASALELLAQQPGEIGSAAQVAYEAVYRAEIKIPQATSAPDVLDWVDAETFFTEICAPERAALRSALWPSIEGSMEDRVLRFREMELRAQLLGATARLGHSLIDMYVLTIGRLKSLDLRAVDLEPGDSRGAAARYIGQYLDLLDAQRRAPLESRHWSAFDELQEVAKNFELILDVNLPESRTVALGEVTRLFGTLLGSQEPTAGMFGEVSKRSVQQFRMPGYPFVLVTTDLLQEGEDLHTFCSSIQHYGISWTPSSMEQRIGRIDRVRSQTDRRLQDLKREANGAEYLQVYFPYLQDTVEVLQVDRVLERMNVFLQLMHEGLVTESAEARHLDVRQVLSRGRRPVDEIKETLKTAFPIASSLLTGDIKRLPVGVEVARAAHARLKALPDVLQGLLEIYWTRSEVVGLLLGELSLTSGRIQPFTLIMDSFSNRMMVRCISPIGRLDLIQMQRPVSESAQLGRIHLGAIPGRDPGSYNLTVQEGVLLGQREHDAERVASMLKRVSTAADHMEWTHLGGADQKLDAFSKDLQREGRSSA